MLSVAFCAALWPLDRWRSTRRAVLIGAAFGVALYIGALHVATLVLPWFAAARGGIALAAHVAFGVSAAAWFRYLRWQRPA